MTPPDISVRCEHPRGVFFTKDTIALKTLGNGELAETHGRTYDILPASDSGTYVAGGALIRSTLFAR